MVEEPCGVGGDRLRSGVAGKEAIAYGVGTDDAMEGVGIVCVSKGDQESEIGLVGEPTVEFIALNIGQSIPAQVAHMVAYDNGTGEVQRNSVLRLGRNEGSCRCDK